VARLRVSGTLFMTRRLREGGGDARIAVLAQNVTD
jgi:hypothetical protein